MKDMQRCEEHGKICKDVKGMAMYVKVEMYVRVGKARRRIT